MAVAVAVREIKIFGTKEITNNEKNIGSKFVYTEWMDINDYRMAKIYCI